jgi:hypothetical protein
MAVCLGAEPYHTATPVTTPVWHHAALSGVAARFDPAQADSRKR